MFQPPISLSPATLHETLIHTNKGTYDTVLYRDKAMASIKHHYNTYTDEVNDNPYFLWAAMHAIHSELDADPIPPDDVLTVKNHAYLKVTIKPSNH
jgi:hypothetical protein